MTGTSPGALPRLRGRRGRHRWSAPFPRPQDEAERVATLIVLIVDRLVAPSPSQRSYANTICPALQFANYEQYFDKTFMQHYISTASDPKKVLYYDTGHDLNDFQALEDRYEWLVNQIHLRREPILQETK